MNVAPFCKPLVEKHRLSIVTLLSCKLDGSSQGKGAVSYYLARISPNLPIPVMYSTIALASRQQSWVVKHKPAPTLMLTLPSILSGNALTTS